jgi:hypothetical protein
MIRYGLDVGRFTDRTALVGLDGDVVAEAHLMSGLEFSTQAGILEPLIGKNSLCLVDVTGLGIGLYERLADMGLPVVATTIGSSMSPPKIIANWQAKNHAYLPPLPQRGRVYVGKTHLMGRMLGLVNARALTVAPWCCHRMELRKELGELTVSYTKRGGLSIQNRKGHDDLALGLALAILARDLSSRLLRSADHGSEVQAA